MNRFLLSPAATSDLDSVIDYLNSLPEVQGLRLGEALQDAIYLLARQPGIGHVHEEYSLLASCEVRVFVEGSYLLFYTSERAPVVFLGILHGKRDIDRIMRQRLS